MSVQNVMAILVEIFQCVKENRYSLMDSPCTGIWPSPQWYQQLPVWRRLTWQPQPHLSQQPPAVQPLSLPMWGFVWEARSFKFKVVHISEMAAHINSLLRYLPGHDFNCSRSVGVNSQWACFFSHGRADETIFKCEHRNRTGLPVHTQDLKGGGHIEAWFNSGSVTFVFQRGKQVWMLTYLTVCGESGLCGLTRLQDLGSRHLTFDCLVLDGAPSRHVILSPDIKFVQISCMW